MADASTTDPTYPAHPGDTAAVGTLYQQHHQAVYRYLYYRTGDPQVAEDLTSEVFIRVIRSLQGYRPQDVPFLAWLFQIARNLSIDYYRKVNNEPLVSLEENLRAGNDDPTKDVDRRLTSQKLIEALRNLSEDQRDVIVLRFVSGMPIADVAQALSKSEDAIKGLQRRGLIALRQLLVEWEISYA